VGCLLLLPRLGGAHPLGNFSINHYAGITIHADAVEIRYVIDLAEIPTYQELREVRPEAPADLTPAEGAALAARKAEEWRAGLVLAVNGRRLDLVRREAGFAIAPGAGGLPTLRLTASYRAALDPAHLGATSRLRYEDRNYPGRAGWKEVVVAGAPGIVPARSPLPSTSRSKELTDYPADMLNSPPQDLTADVTFATASASVAAAGEGPMAPGGLGAAGPALAGGGRARGDRFTALIAASDLTPGFVGFAGLVAFALGALHALEPGHGKTVVAAYLVGARGTALHAVLLGTIVTASHTAGVYLLGLVTLYASRYIVPERLYPWLGFASGLLIVALALSLFRRRRRELASGAHEPGMLGHGHGHPHVHAHADDHGHPPGRGHAGHAHAHAHDHPRGPSGHGHHHGHGHGPGHHHHVPPDGRVTLGGLVALGISGGIIPCPAALVVLLSAMALRRIGFGLLLIVAFSLGLALVLVAIGLLMVYARRLLERFRWEGGWLQRLPLASSLAMAILGLGIAAQALVSGGIIRLGS
jgi:ABC-type nickel/cobalt efflux system permease component RcnA